MLGATGCALAQDPITLDIARFIEAMGGCAGTVLARACVRDLFPPEQAARIFAQMLLILSVSPLFAPFVGGWLLPLTGWRSLFWLQGGAALLAWGFVWKLLPESHPGSDRRLHPLHVLADYWAIGCFSASSFRHRPGRDSMSFSPLAMVIDLFRSGRNISASLY